MPMESIKVTNNEGFLSEVKISSDVIVTIAAFAALEVEGVAAVAQHDKNEIMKLFGVKSSKGLEVVFSEDGQAVSVKMSITMRYGYSIPETCEKLQEKVKTALESMVGLKIEEISLTVSDVLTPDK